MFASREGVTQRLGTSQVYLVATFQNTYQRLITLLFCVHLQAHSSYYLVQAKNVERKTLCPRWWEMHRQMCCSLLEMVSKFQNLLAAICKTGVLLLNKWLVGRLHILKKQHMSYFGFLVHILAPQSLPSMLSYSLSLTKDVSTLVKFECSVH